MIEHVADAAHRMDQLNRKTVVDLAAQVTDIHIDNVCQAVIVHVPNMLDDHGATQRTAGVAHHVLKDAEFLGREIDGLARAADAAAYSVENKIAHLQLLRRRLPAAKQHAHAGQKFHESERLDERGSMPLKQHVRTVIDTWTTLKFGNVNRAAFGETLSTGNAELDKLIELESSKIAGFPMRQTVSISMSTAARPGSKLNLPASRVITREMLVTSAKEAPADPSLFAIPQGYRRADMPDVPKAPAQILTLEPATK